MDPCGHNFERAAIVKWLHTGTPTCPISGGPLRSHELYPNRALQEEIAEHGTLWKYTERVLECTSLGKPDEDLRRIGDEVTKSVNESVQRLGVLQDAKRVCELLGVNPDDEATKEPLRMIKTLRSVLADYMYIKSKLPGDILEHAKTLSLIHGIGTQNAKKAATIYTGLCKEAGSKDPKEVQQFLNAVKEAMDSGCISRLQKKETQAAVQLYSEFRDAFGCRKSGTIKENLEVIDKFVAKQWLTAEMKEASVLYKALYDVLRCESPRELNEKLAQIDQFKAEGWLTTEHQKTVEVYSEMHSLFHCTDERELRKHLNAAKRMKDDNLLTADLQNASCDYLRMCTQLRCTISGFASMAKVVQNAHEKGFLSEDMQIAAIKYSQLYNQLDCFSIHNFEETMAAIDKAKSQGMHCV